jgi:hypothetical protein
MSEWTTGEVITASKLNQKEVFISDTAPASPTQGQLWFDTTVNRLKVYDGAAWKLVTAENLNEIATRSHVDLQNIAADDHHAKLHASSHIGSGTDRITGIIPTASVSESTGLEVTATSWPGTQVLTLTISLTGSHDVIVLASIELSTDSNGVFSFTKMYHNGGEVAVTLRDKRLYANEYAEVSTLHRFAGLSGSQTFEIRIMKTTGVLYARHRELVVIAVPV